MASLAGPWAELNGKLEEFCAEAEAHAAAPELWCTPQRVREVQALLGRAQGLLAQPPPQVEAAWRGHEPSGPPLARPRRYSVAGLPPVEARPQATSGSDPAKSGEPHGDGQAARARYRVNLHRLLQVMQALQHSLTAFTERLEGDRRHLGAVRAWLDHHL